MATLASAANPLMMPVGQAQNPLTTNALPTQLTPDAEAAMVERAAATDPAIVRGLKSGARGLKGAVAKYFGEMADSQAMREYADRQAQLSALEAPVVQSVDQVDGVDSALGYLTGKVGQGLPYMVPSVGSGLASRLLRMSPEAAFAAGVGANHPVMAGSVAQRLDADPTTAKLSRADKLRIMNLEGAADAAIFHTVPNMMMGEAVAGANKAGLGRAALDMGRYTAGQGAAMAGVEGLGQVVQNDLNPNRDTSHDNMALVDAAVGGAAGMAPFAVPHAVAAQGVRIGKDVGGSTKDIALKAGDKAIDLAAPKVKSAMDNMPKSADEAAIALGKAGAEIMNRGEDAITRAVLHGKDEDLDTLLRPQEPHPDAIKQDDVVKNEAAGRYATKLLADESAPDYLKQEAQNYLQGNKTADAWTGLSNAAAKWHRKQLMDHDLSDFIQQSGVKVGKAAAGARNFMDNVRDVYQVERRQNAQTPEGEEGNRFNDMLGMMLERDHIRNVDKEDSDQVAYAMRRWMEGWKPGKEPLVPEALNRMFVNPVEAVKSTYDMMRRQGLVDQPDALQKVIDELQIRREAHKSDKQIVADNLKVTNRGDLDRIVSYVRNAVDSGEIKPHEQNLDQLFGANKERVLEAMDRNREKSKSVLADDTGETSGPRLSDEHDDVGSHDDLAAVTNSMNPNEVRSDVRWHHYNDKRSEPYSEAGVVADKEGNTLGDHTTHAKNKAGDIETKFGSNVRRQGYMDYLRERYGENPDELVQRSIDFVQKHAGDLSENERLNPEKHLNKKFYVLREEKASDSHEPMDIKADEFRAVDHRSKDNKWAESTGRNNESGDIGSGKVWLERADGTKFATSTSRIIKRMVDAGKVEGQGGNGEHALAGQSKLLMQGISSLLNSKDAQGNYALSGRVGFMNKPGGQVRWAEPSRAVAKNGKSYMADFKIPEKLRMYSSEGKTLGDAKRVAKEERDRADTALLKSALKRVEDQLKGEQPDWRKKQLEDEEGWLKSALEYGPDSKAFAHMVDRVNALNSVESSEVSRAIDSKRTKFATQHDVPLNQRDIEKNRAQVNARPGVSDTTQIEGKKEPVRTHDEGTGEELHPKTKPTQSPEKPDPQIQDFVLDTLRKGMPTFNAMLKKATFEQKAKMYEVLKTMLEAKTPDNPVWNGKPPKDIEAFGNRARLAIKAIENGTDPEPPKGGKKDTARADQLINSRNNIDLNKADPKDVVWAAVKADSETEGGKVIAAFKDFGKAQEVAEAYGANVENNTVGALLKRSNTQKTDSKTATPEEQAKFKEDIARRLGADMKAALHDELLGKNAKGDEIKLSGDWEPGAIRASIHAQNIGQIGAHESMHEFFDRLIKGGQNRVVDILSRAANSEPVVNQLKRLLDDHPEALKQLSDPAERIAYMFQFHQAGILKIGPETQTTFQKVSNFFRKVVGMLTDEQKAEAIMNAFDQGRMQTADAAAHVLANNIEARENMIKGAQNFIKPVTKVYARTFLTAASNLERTNNPHLQAVREMFKKNVGEGGEQSNLEAKDHQLKQWSNKLASVFDGYEKGDLELAASYLHAKRTGNNARANEVVGKVRNLLESFHEYLRDAKVQRWEENENGEGGVWKDIGYRKDFFPQAYDTAMLIEKPGEFVNDLMAEHADILARIAEKANDEVRRGTDAGENTASATIKDRLITAQDVAEAIGNRLINSYGQKSIEENTSAVGFSPFMRSVNQRTLDWLSPKLMEKWGEKDAAKVLTSYLAQGVKRAEYVRRFGNDGGVLRDKLVAASAYEIGSRVSDKFGVPRADIEGIVKNFDGGNERPLDEQIANYINKAGGSASAEQIAAEMKSAAEIIEPAAKDIMAMEGTLGYDINPTLRRAENSLMVYQNMRTMGLSLFSQLIDPLGIVVRGGTMKDAWDTYLRGMKEVWASWKGDHTHDEAAKIAEQVGTTDAHGFLAAFGQLYSSMFMGGKFRKANDMLFRINGMEGFNRGIQIAATQAAINFIKRHGSGESKHSDDFLRELNLTKDEVKAKTLKDGNLDYNDPRIQQAIHRWVNGAILRPNAGQRPAWASDPHYMIFWHMKQFAYTFHDTIMKRAMYEVKKHDDLGPAAALVATYTPMMIAADAAKAILMSGEEPAWMRAGLPSMIEHGAMRAGLTGMWQPATDAYVSGRGLTSLAGPSVEQLTSLFSQPVGESLTQALPGASVWNAIHGNAGKMADMGED